MTIKRIEIFLTIAETKNISVASRMLFMSQSAVSSQLKAMENDLGYPLFTRHRGNSRLVLTSQGEAFLEIARQMLSLYNKSLDIKHDIKKEFVFAGVDTLNTYLFIPLFSQFANRQSDVRMKIYTLNSHEILDAVENNTADFGVIFEPEKRDSLIIEPFFSSKLYVVKKRESHTPLGLTFIHPSELDFSRELCMWMGSDYVKWRNQWCKHYQYGYIQIYTLTQMLKLLDLKGSWGIVPEFVVSDLLKNDMFSLYELSDPPPRRIAYKVKPKISCNHNEAFIKTFEKSMDNFIVKNGLPLFKNFYK